MHPQKDEQQNCKLKNITFKEGILLVVLIFHIHRQHLHMMFKRSLMRTICLHHLMGREVIPRMLELPGMTKKKLHFNAVVPKLYGYFFIIGYGVITETVSS